MVETLIIAPVIVVLVAGIFEFGVMLVNKLEMETGLRDAARYLARCQGAAYGCDAATAKNIAVYGSPTIADPPPLPRVIGWNTADVVIDSQGPKLIDNPIDPTDGTTDYRGPAQIYVVQVSTDFDYAGGPLLGLIGIASIPMAAFHEQRYIGW